MLFQARHLKNAAPITVLEKGGSESPVEVTLCVIYTVVTLKPTQNLSACTFFLTDDVFCYYLTDATFWGGGRCFFHL